MAGVSLIAAILEHQKAGKWISLVPEFQVVEDHPDDGMPVFEAGEIQVLPEPTGDSQ